MSKEHIIPITKGKWWTVGDRPFSCDVLSDEGIVAETHCRETASPGATKIQRDQAIRNAEAIAMLPVIVDGLIQIANTPSQGENEETDSIVQGIAVNLLNQLEKI